MCQRAVIANGAQFMSHETGSKIDFVVIMLRWDSMQTKNLSHELALIIELCTADI